MSSNRGHRHTVAVQPGTAVAERPRLLAALEAAFPVAFVANREGAEALIAFCDGESLGAERLTDAQLPTMAFGSGQHRPRHPVEVRLEDVDAIDRRVRGLRTSDLLNGPDLGPSVKGQEVLAQSRSGPAWTRSRGPVAVHRVRSSLPELGPSQPLRDLLAEHALALIALLHFLRAIAADDRYEPPPIRASILFDDPNLRWRTYGFIDYRQLLRHADEHDYHAAMAMIPLDGPRQHRATVNLFKARPDRLSLVLHGNNHVAGELMRPDGDPGALPVAAQAMRRAARFEARYGLRMDRVMTPPHGLCSASVAEALGAVGFDALCAIHPLPWTEDVPGDRPLAGWEPAEFAAGCAVIPRVPLTTPFDQIALRAFLDQPLILYGHHADLAGGLDLLADTAARINRLGDVRWASLGEIAELNYTSQLQDGILRIRPYAHRLVLDPPEGVRSLLLKRPRSADHGMAGWSNGGAVVPFDTPVPRAPGRHEIRLRPTAWTDAETVPGPPPGLWPVLRRVATETRDRLQPLLSMDPA
jgi:hypothetical protein